MHTMEHSPTEVGCKWMELETILLHEVTQTKKDKHHMFSHLQSTAPDPQMGSIQHGVTTETWNHGKGSSGEEEQDTSNVMWKMPGYLTGEEVERSVQ